MLQQTRVETVIPLLRALPRALPRSSRLATAEPDDVLGAWAGLGYYSRARNLQAAAREVVAERGGELPDDVEGLRALPGVGRYTAGAVASIAFDRPSPGGRRQRRARARAAARDPRGRAAPAGARDGSGSEAGALARGPSARRPEPGADGARRARLHAPRAPTARGLPGRARCAGAAERRPGGASGEARAGATPRAVEAVAAFVVRRGRALAVRRPPRGLLGGLWELPGGELARGRAPRGRPGRGAPRAGRPAARRRPRGSAPWSTPSRTGASTSTSSGPRGAGGRVRLGGFDAHRWLPPALLADLPQSALTRKALLLVSRS